MDKHNLYDTAQNFTQKQLSSIGSTMVIAPHQDDESLGCGGTITLLRQLGCRVHVVFISDGSMSHPNSKLYPAQKLVALRKNEAIAALHFLGVSKEEITFLDLPDGRLPHQNDLDFDKAVNSLQSIIEKVKPQTILLPWRRDPHTDHRATWQIVNRATEGPGQTIKKLEYFIWLWERADDDDAPKTDEGTLLSVNISTVTEQKRKAIAAHVSQTTKLIDDDPDGFMLSAEVLDHFSGHTELFIECKPMSLTNQSLSENYFNNKYHNNDDPWGFETSTYEHDKYNATINALPEEKYQNAFEIGCSIGVLSKMLADKCTKLLAVDVADSPLVKAREKLVNYPWVTFEKMAVPEQFPTGDFDLIVMSEVAYFFNQDDLKQLYQKIITHLAPKGNLLLVHWTPVVPEHPLTGDEVHDLFMQLSGEDKTMKHVLNQRADTYRLDLFEKL